ncbi:hypothetical protein [Pinibacter soli]|uniref:Uncharacterized protein n=1 Tax=Pinibacter soli TaxID=3044211 RepID=A0ABT6RCV4_9BACT|nr:hypothetical protein [Pinibacter soli]MDI3320394.1 hypothetical protein [Pinibacter soli]
MNKLFSPLILFILCSVYVVAQNKSCLDVRNGLFYYYPKTSAAHYIDFRNGDSVHEIETEKGDTSVWSVKWLSDCRYKLQYVSGGNFNEKQVELLKKSTPEFEISKVADSYYVFDGFVDKKQVIVNDTMWLHEKVDAGNTQIFWQLKPNVNLKKLHFSDTSKYAILYVYRPGKLSNSLGQYNIYINNEPLCVGQNNTGYGFAIIKEGRYEIKSKLYKDASSTFVDIKFGNVYYVKSMVHWAITSRLYNFKLEMATMKPEDGKIEFAEVDQK